MTKADVLALLEANKNERGVHHWNKTISGTGGLQSFGIGLTQLRKIARQIGKDHGLAAQLWDTDNHDARVISLLIDDPKQLTREQVENQVQGVRAGMLAHVFSSCDATLAKSPLAFDLAREWIQSDDPLRRQCGYGLVYELSKNKKLKELTDDFFIDCINRIRRNFDRAGIPEKMSIGTALMGIGKRNKSLNATALELARLISPIDFNESNGKCDSFDIVKHLTSQHLKKKLGI
jgi:hypothetical protein